MLLSESFGATRTLTRSNDRYRIPVMGVDLFLRRSTNSAFRRCRDRKPALACSVSQGDDRLEHRLGVARVSVLRIRLLAIRTRPREVVSDRISHRDVIVGRQPLRLPSDIFLL